MCHISLLTDSESAINLRQQSVPIHELFRYRPDIELFWLSGNFWLVSFKISYLCLPLFYETRTTPSCHPSGCAYRQL